MNRWLVRLSLSLLVFFALPMPVAASSPLFAASWPPVAASLPPIAAVVQGESHLDHRLVEAIGVIDDGPQAEVKPPGFWHWLIGQFEATPQWLVNLFKGAAGGLAGGLLALGGLALAGLFVAVGSISALAVLVGGAIGGALYGLFAGDAFSWLAALGAGLVGGLAGWGAGLLGGLGGLLGRAKGLVSWLPTLFGRLRWPWGKQPAWRWLAARFINWGGPALLTNLISGNGFADSLLASGLIGLLGIGAEILLPSRLWIFRDMAVYGVEAYIRRLIAGKPPAQEPEPDSPTPNPGVTPGLGVVVPPGIVPPVEPAPVVPTPQPTPVLPAPLPVQPTPTQPVAPAPVVPWPSQPAPTQPAPSQPWPMVPWPVAPWPTEPAPGFQPVTPGSPPPNSYGQQWGFITPPFVFTWPSSPGLAAPVGPPAFGWLPAHPLLVAQFWWVWLSSWPGLFFAPWGWFGPMFYPGWGLFSLPTLPGGWPAGWGLGLEPAQELELAGD